MILIDRTLMHLGQHRVSSSDRQERQRAEQKDNLEPGLHLFLGRGHAQMMLRGPTITSTSSNGHRNTPFKMKVARKRRIGIGPCRHFLPVLTTMARVNATAAAAAP